MTVEIRNGGDKLIVYTTYQTVVNRLMRWKGFLYSIPYIQNGRIIAFDVYMEKSAKQAILKSLNLKQLPMLVD